MRAAFAARIDIPSPSPGVYRPHVLKSKYCLVYRQKWQRQARRFHLYFRQTTAFLMVCCKNEERRRSVKKW